MDVDEAGARRAWGRLTATAVLLVLAAVAFGEMDEYAVSYDAVFDFPQGEAHLQKLLTGRTTFTATDRERCPYRIADFEEIVGRADRFGTIHGQFPTTVSAAFCRVLHQEAGWLGVTDAHNLPILLAALALLGVVYAIGERADGPLAGLAAVALCAAHPRFVADAFANYKDMAVALVSLSGCLLVLRASEQRRPLGVFAAFALLGLGMASKVSTALAPAAILFWALVEGHAGSLWRRYRGWLVPGAAIAVLFAFLFWPSLHVPPLAGRVAAVLDGIVTHGSADAAAPSERHRVPLHAAYYFLVASPEAYLLALLVGIAIVTSRRREPKLAPARLAMVLGGAFIVAFSLPGVFVGDGLRYALSAVPAFAVVGGIGLSCVARCGASGVALPVWGLYSLLLAWPVLSTHPFELAYFNEVSGGLAAAKRRGIPAATDYWGLSYRRVVRWLNEHAPPGTPIVSPLRGPLLAADEELRPDLQVVSETADWCRVDGDVILVYVTREEFYARHPIIGIAERSLEPVLVFRSQGAPILKLYRESASALCGLLGSGADRSARREPPE